MRLALFAAVLLLVVGCGQDQLNGQFGVPQPLPSSTATQRELSLGDDRVRVWPASAEVEPNTAYRYVAYTHCGLDHLLDFDGSFWEVTERPGGPRHEVIDNPDDEGIILLVDEDSAVYVSSKGAPFSLERVDGPREVRRCE